ncbi:glycine zipper 2TM domain-containing protein [Glacieibacterium sp.]|uniref:glycine zipper 2TM domain-containing protein n=1 Tax=Glacieibacterium sp. TaxID=2860237 RepID=UPI003B008906
MLRKLTLGLSALSILSMPIAATAQDNGYRDRDSVSRQELRDNRDNIREQRQDVRDAQRYGTRQDVREERRDLREARNEQRRDRQDWRTYRNYDYNRPQPGNRAYYADQYYRDGRYYQPRRLSVNDRIYRGQDNRYYCRRSDGTTGLVIGALGGGVLGNALSAGGSKTLGTLLGGGLGGLLGRSVDRNNVSCR